MAGGMHLCTVVCVYVPLLLWLRLSHDIFHNTASRIIGVDVNPKKFEMAQKLGATDCVDSTKLDMPVQKHIATVMTKWGVDYSFDCTGNVQVMRAALECAHRGWGTSCVIGMCWFRVVFVLSVRCRLVCCAFWKCVACFSRRTVGRISHNPLSLSSLFQKSLVFAHSHTFLRFKIVPTTFALSRSLRSCRLWPRNRDTSLPACDWSKVG